MKRYQINNDLDRDRLALRCFIAALAVLVLTLAEVHFLNIGPLWRLVGVVGVLAFTAAGTLALFGKR